MATVLKPPEPSVEAVRNALAEYIESENMRRKSPPQPHSYLYASARRKCLRRSVLECTRPELMPEFEVETKARFLRGDQREVDLRLEMTRAGQLSDPRFDFIGIQEPVKIYDRKRRLVISGKIDGFIRWENGETWPTEIKAWHPNVVDRIQTFEDICNGPWTWSGAHQLLSYLYAKNVPFGIFALDRSGLPKLIPVSLEDNLQRMEDFLRDAESVVDHIESRSLPEVIKDPAECKRCWAYGSLCNPPLMSGEGARIITDPAIEQMLERRHELEDAADEFARIDKDIKARFRGVELAIAGTFLLEGKFGKLTKDNTPAEVKKLYQTVDPKGRFTLSITKVS
ncbi:MAG: hypothetical protein GXX84_15665 [Acidobacteria bacterium]|nr:hypothetical protein [Acidobacteriota bacterium]